MHPYPLKTFDGATQARLYHLKLCGKLLNPYLHTKSLWMTASAVKVNLLCAFCDTNSYIYTIKGTNPAAMKMCRNLHPSEYLSLN